MAYPRSSVADPVVNLSPKVLLMKFESLGENCEFGLVQRRCGAEPLGLLRFASSPLPKLLAALRGRFTGMGTPQTTEIHISSNGKEYMVADLQYGFEYHAWVNVAERTADEIHRRELRRIPFLVDKLTDDLRLGEKIFVYHGMKPLTDDDALTLHSAMITYGPATLLWVELADEQHPSGRVEWVHPGVLKAHIDRFAPGDNAHDVSLDGWLAVCGAAQDLFEAKRAEPEKLETEPVEQPKYLGYVDEVNRLSVTGWAVNQANWSQSLKVDVLVDGKLSGECDANLFRRDLEKLRADATGRYMFRFNFPAPLPAPIFQDVQVRIQSTNYVLIKRTGTGK